MGFFEQKIASNTYQGLCMRRIIRESETMGFNITMEMENIKRQLEALSRYHVIAIFNQHLDALEDIREEAVDLRARLKRLEDRLLNDCPDENGVF